jgi:isoleucyl-tRNA synthetase
MDARLRDAVDNFDFNSYVRLITEFANEDLSAFFFDIRKDCLDCDGPDDPKRRAYRTTLDLLFHALIRWAAPVLVFTVEEIWSSRYPDTESVHLLTWPEIGSDWKNPVLNEKWDQLRTLRESVTMAIEPFRRDKVIRSSLEASVRIGVGDATQAEAAASLTKDDLAELFIVSEAETITGEGDVVVSVEKTGNAKCGRCWRHMPEVESDGHLCHRCAKVLNG